jgi:hypothetical protein
VGPLRHHLVTDSGEPRFLLPVKTKERLVTYVLALEH